MLSKDIHALADQLSDRAVIRAEAIDAWVSLALEQVDPSEWIGALVASALDRLNMVQESLVVKAEARLQVLDIQRSIHVGIANSRKEPPRPLPFEASVQQTNSPPAA